MSHGAGSRVQGVPVTARQLAGSARQPVGVLARRRHPAHPAGSPRRRRARPLPPPPAGPTCRRVPVGRCTRLDGPRADRRRRARRHLHRRVAGPAGRRSWSPSGTAPRARRTARTRVMSVTKSVVGCVAAVLVDRGLLDPTTASPTTSPSSPAAATPAPRCATCSTCAAGCGSWRTTPTRTPTSGSWTSGSAGDRDAGRAPRALRVPGHAAWPRRRTASGSCTARRRPTCWAGSASARPGRRWPS